MGFNLLLREADFHLTQGRNRNLLYILAGTTRGRKKNHPAHSYAASFVFVWSNVWQRGHEIINLLRGTFLFFIMMYITHTAGKTKTNETKLLPKTPFWSFRSVSVRQMKALFFCHIVWICYHSLLHECLPACDACSEGSRGDTEGERWKLERISFVSLRQGYLIFKSVYNLS